MARRTKKLLIEPPLNSERGFTLLEILIIVTVTAIISAFAVVYSNVSKTQLALYAEQQKVAGLILKAKSLAIETHMSAGQGGGVHCGYGIKIDYGANPQSYGIFYYNRPGPTDADPQCDTIKNAGIDPSLFDAGSDLPSFDLDRGIILRSSEPDSLVYVLFVPPNPTTVIDTIGNNPSLVAGNVYLTTKDGSASAVVAIEPGGQVDF
jgi:hypothetical protein